MISFVTFIYTVRNEQQQQKKLELQLLLMALLANFVQIRLLYRIKIFTDLYVNKMTRARIH